MNNLILEGHLVEPVTVKTSEKGDRYCYGKIGVYNGKDRDGEVNPSMFIQFTAFGKEVANVEEAPKGSLIMVSGRLSREDTTGDNGKEYVNLKVTCNSVRLCVKPSKKDEVVIPKEEYPWGEEE